MGALSKFVILDQPLDGTGPFVSFPMGVDDYQARYQALHVPTGLVAAWPGTPTGPALDLITPGPSKLTRGTLASGVPYVRAPGGPLAGNRIIGPHATTQPFTVAAVLLVEQAGTFSVLGIRGGLISVTANPVWSANVGGQILYTSQATIGSWVAVVVSVTADNRLRYRVSAQELLSAGTVAAPPASAGGLYFGPSTTGKPAAAAEILYWDRELNLAERETFHAYAQKEYGAV